MEDIVFEKNAGLSETKERERENEREGGGERIAIASKYLTI